MEVEPVMSLEEYQRQCDKCVHRKSAHSERFGCPWCKCGHREGCKCAGCELGTMRAALAAAEGMRTAFLLLGNHSKECGWSRVVNPDPQPPCEVCDAIRAFDEALQKARGK